MVVAGLGLHGLASACVTASALTPDQIYATAINAGFPPAVATQMTAIALRESQGCPDAANVRAPLTNGPRDPGESSYGLWQINIAGNPSLMSQLGITDPSQLTDPAVNAKAAMLLYGGNPANLDTAWYINRGGAYTAQYQANLPAAQQAAADYAAGNGADPSSIDAGMMDGESADSSGGISLTSILTIVGVGLFGLVLISRD